MDAPDAIPSDDARVVIPTHLRGILHQAAESKLRRPVTWPSRPIGEMTWSKRFTSSMPSKPIGS